MDEVAKTQIKDETLKICTRYMEESDLDDEEIVKSAMAGLNEFLGGDMLELTLD